MTSVLFSIRPEWCEKIFSGEKTIEVRKTAPKKVPFKGYIYCTKSGDCIVRQKRFVEQGLQILNGKVIGEFIGDADIPLLFFCSDPNALTTHFEVPGTAMSDVEIMQYLGNGKEGHGLLISDLVVYDTPKELSDFCKLDGTRLHHPPQSWCYVQEETK